MCINLPKEHSEGCAANCGKLIFLGGREGSRYRKSVKGERRVSQMC